MNFLAALFYDLAAYEIIFEERLNRLHKQRIQLSKKWLYHKTGIEL